MNFKAALFLPALLLAGPLAWAGPAFSQLQGPEEQLALLCARAGLAVPADATPVQLLRIAFAAAKGKTLPTSLKARFVGDGFLNSDDPLPANTLPFPQGGANTLLQLAADQSALVNFGGDLRADQFSDKDLRHFLQNPADSYSNPEYTADGTTLISYADAPYPGGFRTLELRQLGPFVIGASRRDDLEPQYGGIETFFLFYKRIDKWDLFPAVISRAKTAAKNLQN